MNRRRNTISEILDRVPPHDSAAEKAVLASVLIRPDALDDVASIVRPEDFYADANRLIFEAMQTISDSGKAVDAVLLQAQLKTAGQLEAIGGMAYLLEVADASATAATVEHYAKQVRSDALKRRAIEAACDTLRESYGRELDGQTVISNADKRFLAVGDVLQDREPVSISKATGEAVAIATSVVEQGRRHGIRTGIIEFDSRLGGLFPGECSILAARPRMGKTSLAGQVALNVALRNEPVLFVSLEMSARELAWRLACSEAAVNSNRLRTGQLSADDLAAIRDQQEALANVPLTILDAPTLTALDVRRTARRAKRQGQLGLLMLDYLQRLDPMERRANRNESVGASSRLLKEAAQELQVPVLCLAQLNRGVEASGNHRPNLGSLRDSGEVEQDADVVLFLHRAEVYQPGDPDLKGRAELIVAKNRNGPTAEIQLHWHPENTAFTPWVGETGSPSDDF